MASVARARGDQAGAARRLREALTLSAKVGDRGNAACCLEALAVIAAGRDDLMRAARLWGAAQTQLDAVEAAVYPHTPDRAMHEQAVAHARARSEAEAWATAWAAGRALSFEQAVAEGDALASEFAAAVPPSAPNPAARHPAGLTGREVVVLALVAQGLTNAQVAGQLFLSPRTIDTHLQRIYTKVDVSTRGGAIRFALDHGLA